MKFTLNETEKDIFGQLLETCADELSNNGCNDYPVPVTDENREEMLAFIDEVAEDEDQRASFRRQADSGEVYFLDWMLVSFLKSKILGE